MENDILEPQPQVVHFANYAALLYIMITVAQSYPFMQLS